MQRQITRDNHYVPQWYLPFAPLFMLHGEYR